MSEKKRLEEFYTFCLTTCSERRLKKIQGIINHSKRIVGKDLTKLKVKDVVNFLAHINQSKLTDWTRNDYKKIFKRYLKWQYKDLELIEGAEVKQGFRGVSKKRAFNKEKINRNTLVKPRELEKIIRAAKSLKWKALISFLYESAFRPCEVRALKWKDLKFDENRGICRAWILSPKTQDSREVPVKDCVVHLKRWKAEYQFENRKDSDYVFPSQHKAEKQMGEEVITKMLKRICADAKIRNINAYLFRHSRIYEIQKRLPEKIAAKFGGHSLETSEIYNHMGDEDVEESMLGTIYTTKELSNEEKTALEKKVENQDEKIKMLQEAVKQWKYSSDVGTSFMKVGKK